MQQPPGGYGQPPGGYGPPPGGYGQPPPMGPPPGGFGPPPGGGYGPPPGGFGPPIVPQKKGMSTGMIILLVILILMVVGGGGTCVACYCFASKVSEQIDADQKANDKKNTQAKQAAMKVDLKVLLKEYEDNEVRADASYKGKYIEFTGKVDDVKKDVLDKMYVTIGTGKVLEIPQVQCYFDDKAKSRAATLSKGNSITVRGRVDGLLFNVQVKDCEFL